MELVAKKFVSAVLIVVALAGSALAGDVEAAKRDLRGAEMNLEEHQKRYEQARMYVERARKNLEGVDAAARAPIDAQIEDILRRARLMELESWRRTATGEIERIFSFAESKLEGWGAGDTRVVDVVMSDVDRRLPEALGRENAKASLTDEDKVSFQARRTELLEACKRKKIETHFHSASERIDRIERSEDLDAGNRASWIAFVDENLAPDVVPQDDPRVRQLKARLEAVLAKQDQAHQAAAQAEKIKRATDEWEGKKRQFARDCPAWEYEVVNEYARWRQTRSLNVDKALRRHELAEEMAREETYKEVVQWFAADPSVVALVGEVGTWREEAGTKVCAAANALLDEVEKHQGDDGLAPDLQGLLTLLEQRTAGAPQAPATLTRARAAVVSAGGTPASAPGASVDGAVPVTDEAEAESSGGGVFLKLLLGLMCCFGSLAVVGGVGFVAYKQMNAAKPAPPGG